MSDPYHLVGNTCNVIKSLAKQVYEMTRTSAPSIWIGRGWDDNSTEHATGRALDIIVSQKVGNVPADNEKAAGDAVAVWLVKHANQLHVQHLIWNKKIWRRRRSYEGWRPLLGRSASSSRTDWHVDHIHVFLDDTGGTVPTSGLSVTKTVGLAGLLNAVRTDPNNPSTKTTNWAAVQPVQAALMLEGLLDKKYVDGHFGNLTRAAYKKWQEKLGYRGADADGIPGLQSLKALSHNRFEVKN